MPGLREWLGELPGGGGRPLDWDEVGSWIKKQYVNHETDIKRRERHRIRHQFFIGSGHSVIERDVDIHFRDPEARANRKEWVRKGGFNNAIRRVVNELATCYSVPAARTVKGEDDNERYQEVQRLSRQHEMMRRVNRWGTLHRNVAVGFRVRQEHSGIRRPVIDVVSPDCFFAIAHPLDATRLIGLGFELFINSPLDRNAPRWIIWTDQERFFLDREGFVIKDSVDEHGFARMPWLLFSLEPPSGKLLDGTTMEDGVAAQRAIWFENICLLKESKSATKNHVLSGDMTRAARQQALDSEVPIETPEGVVVSTVDNSMDLSMFRDTANHIYETFAANHGLAPGVLRHQGVQSAEARELMRAPLKELRREQQVYLREFEREFAEVQAMVLARDMRALSFSTDGWSIDFGDTATPLDPKSELEVFQQARKLGLTDTVEELKRRNPDLSTTQALMELQRHIKVEVLRNEMMRPLHQISGSMSADVGPSAPGDADPDGRDEGDADPNGRDESDAGLRAIDGGI